ncbi:hypothetical protein OSB04_008560 [Centaurea solstitialis]|uniref:Uncharacterized protein n=1 Tax=Centaurea solstitialis TaxID=347529 RepID=A0AA38TM11_9ASTR|nr:hypothetical protein OSB04_008560 [Centaurea solstitialis]
MSSSSSSSASSSSIYHPDYDYDVDDMFDVNELAAEEAINEAVKVILEEAINEAINEATKSSVVVTLNSGSTVDELGSFGLTIIIIFGEENLASFFLLVLISLTTKPYYHQLCRILSYQLPPVTSFLRRCAGRVWWLEILLQLSSTAMPWRGSNVVSGWSVCGFFVGYCAGSRSGDEGRRAIRCVWGAAHSQKEEFYLIEFPFGYASISIFLKKIGDYKEETHPTLRTHKHPKSKNSGVRKWQAFNTRLITRHKKTILKSSGIPFT